MTSLSINTDVLITGAVSLLVALIAHRVQFKNAKLDAKTKSDTSELSSLQATVSELRKELSEMRQANVDLRDLNYKLSLELKEAGYEAKLQESDIKRMTSELDDLKVSIAKASATINEDAETQGK